MNTDTAPNHPSLAAQLPAGAYYYLMQSLRRMLPLLRNDTPEDRVRRNQSAMARVAALCPASVAEAEVAALHVANAEHAKACLFDAQGPELSLREVLKCRAQAASMSRQSDSSLRMLLRMQAARLKRDANPEARERAAWAEHCAINLMAEALSPPLHPSRSVGDAGSRNKPGEGALPVEPRHVTEPNPHLSRWTAEIAALSAACDGAPGNAKEPQSAAKSAQHESTPVERPQPARASTDHDSPMFRRTDSPVHSTDRCADLSDDDLHTATMTALKPKPASVTKDEQPAQAAETQPRTLRADQQQISPYDPASRISRQRDDDEKDRQPPRRPAAPLQWPWDLSAPLYDRLPSEQARSHESP